jgi:predicted aspartyl protease
VVLALSGVAAFAQVRPLVDVPLRYVRGAALIDHVRINGQGDYTFLLDTGSTACTITSEVADELHLTRGKWSNVASIGSTKKLRAAQVKSIAVEGALVDAPLTLISDDNGLSAHVGGAVHGVLGTPFLWKWPVQLDFPARRFRVLPRDFDVRTEPVESPWSSVAGFTLRSRAAYIPVALNGGQPHAMMLDTGATGIVITDSRAKEAKARTARVTSTSVGPFGPRRQSAYWILDSVRVAGLTVDNAQAFTPESVGDWRSEQLGNDVLEQFRVTVDAARRLVRFDRDQMAEWWPEGAKASPWGVGLVTRRDPNGIRVAKLWPDSDAAAKGIQPGDELVAVDGNEAASVQDGSLNDLLSQPPGYPVAVTVRAADGAERKLDLVSRRYVRKRPSSTDDAIARSLSVIQPDSPK